MKRFIILWCVFTACTSPSTNSKDLTTVFEASDGTATATYDEIIAYYNTLAKEFPTISIERGGETDSGYPLHLVTFNPKQTGTNFKNLGEDNSIILINNGIHPGESDGIDATMMLFRDLANGQLETPENTIVVTIPVYNIGGCLNRNSTTRTNQNGPESYGFRGNARNYDLNRDFIKTDTKNALSFSKLFHRIQPDIFIDTHVSNGADYQYTLTHLFTQHNKLGGPLGTFLHKDFMPELEGELQDNNWDITPYVNVFNRTPEQGFSQFFDSPRYSTGYTTLFNTLGFMIETHMLKPYKQRVEGTYAILKNTINLADLHERKLTSLKAKQEKYWLNKTYYPLHWELDTTKHSQLQFKGYKGQMIESQITGAKRLKYDKTQPFVKDIPYKNYFKATDSIKIPKAYIIPQEWHGIIERLEANNIQVSTLENDTTLTVETYRITDYKTRRNPYEGHYLHYNTQLEARQEDIQFKKGDYLILTHQPSLRYIIETLEPQATDSFFNWNFFDTILQQKEGFSPYVWEDKAQLLLRTNPKLQIAFNMKKSLNKDFADNWYAQLEWLHKQSPYYEKAHMTYPVYRVNP